MIWLARGLVPMSTASGIPMSTASTTEMPVMISRSSDCCQ